VDAQWGRSGSARIAVDAQKRRPGIAVQAQPITIAMALRSHCAPTAFVALPLRSRGDATALSEGRSCHGACFKLFKVRAAIGFPLRSHCVATALPLRCLRSHGAQPGIVNL